MNGAHSPTGDVHPGVIEHSDATTGRIWQRKAAEVPQTIAWGQIDGRWIPVVRVKAAGNPGQRRISRFGPDGQLIDSTVQAPPRPRPAPGK